jgi:hypothetical protein
VLNSNFHFASFPPDCIGGKGYKYRPVLEVHRPLVLKMSAIR